jgi:hypothetical protein
MLATGAAKQVMVEVPGPAMLAVPDQLFVGWCFFIAHAAATFST